LRRLRHLRKAIFPDERLITETFSLQIPFSGNLDDPSAAAVVHWPP